VTLYKHGNALILSVLILYIFIKLFSSLYFWYLYVSSEWNQPSFFSLRNWGLNSETTPRATPPAFFCGGLFWDRVLQTISPSWLWTSILLISASWVSRITGVNHWCLVERPVFLLLLLMVLGLDLRTYTLSHSTSPFFVKSFFELGKYPWAGFEPRCSWSLPPE
jgi:hypothetical protein